MKTWKILFTGGGTGGHIFPIIALVREIRRICPKDRRIEFYYMGPKDEFGELLLTQEGVKVKFIMAGKIRRYWNIKSFFQNLIDIFFKFPLGFFQAFFYIFFLVPDLIFSKGGYGALPVVLAGYFLGSPVFLHESDVSPGIANKIASKFAQEIFVSFSLRDTEYFSPQKVISVGNPIRREILEGSIEEGKKIFELSGEKPVILVLGGSQGAMRINDLILNILPEILKDFELLHQCGEKNFTQVRAESKVVIDKHLEKYYHLFPFLKEEELKHAYAVADLVISRAGAGSIFEIAACGKPSILIPLPESAQDHQAKNAYTYARSGACQVIEEVNLTPHFFLGQIKYLFSSPEKLKEMGRRAKNWSHPKAGKIIAEYIISFLLK